MAAWWMAVVAMLMATCPLHAAEAFRAAWAEVFRPGYKSSSEINVMVYYLDLGNYNAVLPELLAYHDSNGSTAHGAFWNSTILPEAPAVTTGFDPLDILCQQAHAKGIEVHPWIIPYRVSLSWPPTGNSIVSAHPEWIMVPLASMGGGPAMIDSAYYLDPGSPDVQEYVVSIVRELVQKYPIDGINFDYIRYVDTDAGYPASTSYTKSSLARFRQITGRTDTPSSGDSQWSDFRRRTIDELVRRCRAEVVAARPLPDPQVRFTADLICWGDVPGSFSSSSAYALFQNWQKWMQAGWLDASIIMNYKMEHCPPQNSWYRNWVNAAVNWSYSRHAFIGQANYMNSKANSVIQMAYAYGAQAEGTANYNYYQTVINSLVCSGFTSLNDMTWYAYVRDNLFTDPVDTPKMPWRDPATATEGTVWGQITCAGQSVDDATVTISGSSPVQTDGNGWYIITLIPAMAGGTSYSMTVVKNGLPSGSHPAAFVFPGDLTRYDFVLGAGSPTITVSPPIIERTIIRGTNPLNDTMTIRNTGDGALNYTITTNADWLSVLPVQGTCRSETDSISVIYDASALGFGQYTGVVTVKDAAAPNTPQTVTVNLTVTWAGIPGDFDGDNDVDQSDFGVFQSCLSGPGVVQNDPACDKARLDSDRDVDIDDLRLFSICMTGPGISGSPTCAD